MSLDTVKTEVGNAIAAWADQEPDSMVATMYRKPLASILRVGQVMSSASFADILCLLAAAHTGGYRSGVKEAETFTRDHVQPQTYYTVWTTVDENSRRGTLVGVFSQEDQAKDAAKGKGWYGGIGEIRTTFGVILDDTLYFTEVSIPVADINQNLPDKIEKAKAAALAKLTPAEIKLLGIKA